MASLYCVGDGCACAAAGVTGMASVKLIAASGSTPDITRSFLASMICCALCKTDCEFCNSILTGVFGGNIFSSSFRQNTSGPACGAAPRGSCSNTQPDSRVGKERQRVIL